MRPSIDAEVEGGFVGVSVLGTGDASPPEQDTAAKSDNAATRATHAETSIFKAPVPSRPGWPRRSRTRAAGPRLRPRTGCCPAGAGRSFPGSRTA